MSKPHDLSAIDSNTSEQISAYSDVLLDDEEEEYIGESPARQTTTNISHINTPVNWRETLALSFSSLGAIYGDIATSPLYVLNSIKYPNEKPTKKDIYGAVLVIFYVFTFIVVIKYILIVLFIGPNNGEGGQVAIYAKIARHLKIGPKGVTIPGGPEKDDLLLLTRQDTSLSFVSMNKRLNNFKNSPAVIKCVSTFILIACFIGCSLVISDGLLTPTTSVLSAIAGIQIAVPSFNSVLAVSEVILIFLFVLQQVGSTKISFIFAPIVFLWLIGLIICGIYNIVVHHPGIFEALSPYYAIELLKSGGIDVFSGAMLSITGTEAMFADIGHFGRLPIQISLMCFVYPALVLCYLGQAAYILHHPEALESPFFYSVPGGLNSAPYWIMFVLATLSTIIASQALILGVFSILSQLINLDCFPNLRVVHVSKKYAGKVYIPVANWVLMVGVVCTTAGFKNSNNVTAAYGLGISLDFLVTSALIILCMIYVYEWNILIPIIFMLVFMPLEAIMVGANLKKFLHGAWFPIMMAGIVFLFLCLWRWGRSRKVDHEFSSRIKIGELFPKLKPVAQEIQIGGARGALKLEQDRGRTRNRDFGGFVEYGISLRNVLADEELVVDTKFGKYSLHQLNGAAIMYTDAVHTLNSPNTVPHMYKTMISSFPSVPKIFIFCAIRILSIPQVQEENRILVGNMKIPGHYRCILRFGYMENVKITEELSKTLVGCIPEGLDTNNIPILHIVSNEMIKAKRSSSNTKNPFVIVQRYVRKFLINNVFATIHSAFNAPDDILDESETNRIFIGEEINI